MIPKNDSQSAEKILPIRVSKEAICKINDLLQEPLKIGGVSHSLNEWIGNSIVEHSNNTVAIAQYAGFQGAVISSGIEEVLFFLENLCGYLKFLNTHFQYIEQIEELESLELSAYNDMGFFVRSYSQDELHAEQALYQACHILDVIWKECIQPQGSFYVNIPVSSISGGPTGFPQTATESKKLIEKIAKSLEMIAMQKAMKFLDKKEPIKESACTGKMESMNIRRHFKGLMITTINDVNLVLVRVLPYVTSIEGIQQAGRAAAVFESTMKKWANQSSPPPAWNQSQKKLVKNIKAVGRILDAWFEVNTQQDSSSIERIAPLLSPRNPKRSTESMESQQTATASLIAEASRPHSKSIFSWLPWNKSTKTSSFSLPNDFIEWDDVKKLKSVKPPLAEDELNIYFHIVDYIRSLKGKRWKTLQSKINNCLSEVEEQQPLLEIRLVQQ
ncbi:hypothetical protein [Legionella fallonii]|uniref:Uncharacterized protein n=1 Tax=Legionella fallonii LLAP-10 TaxID=1212491 RepID=A0A098G6S9_9GAMM|nr:hypothetical protein [Legionella fallonii]CEG57689.1 protein of unknown function [Legionella fallonii LLAP-10]